jgi:lysyl-tRNA synthetase, class II
MEEQRADNEIRAQRLANLESLREAGYPPYGSAYERDGDLAAAVAGFEEGRRIRIAGRLVSRREMGKSIFAHVQDATGRLQVYVKKNEIGEESFQAFRTLDLGDILGLEGDLFVTRTGEQTVKAAQWTLLSKSLQPLPEKFHGLQDVEQRYRRRYVDLIANPAVAEVFRKRSRIVRELRNRLDEKAFIEVETPMLQAIPGGAAANPFQTRYQALSRDMFLRIAPELYLKRMLVGGFDKVFELNRSFRNEGLDRSHNPEFTMLEIYQAYGDVRSMMDLVQDLVVYVAETVCGTLRVGTEERPVDLTPPWREVEYAVLIREAAGDDWFDLDLPAAAARARDLGCDVDPAWDFIEVTQEVFEKKIEKSLIQPTFVTRLPARLVPLARACEDRGDLVDVFELIVDGRELAPGYTELNDPLEQRARFLDQANGDESKLDRDFLDALEVGMPPAGGMGIGIDRLVMTLTGQESIRDVILFPQLKTFE